MNINKKIYVIFFILIGFILNIFFYLFSENYRYFLQSLKYDDNTYKVDDKFKIEIKDKIKYKEKDDTSSIFAGLKEDFGTNTEKKIVKNNNIKQDKKKDLLVNPKKESKENNVLFVNKREELKLTNIEKNILNSFKSYSLKKVELHPRLFDLTGEYPDKYFEYYSKDLTLYFFGNKSYGDLKDIFEVLTYELPFSINEVNNFGQKSFYINLDSLFEDDYIRIIIKKSNRTFGIKIKKELYTKLKDNLKNIFSK